MALIAQGAKRLAIGDRVYDYQPASTWSPRSTCRSPGTTRTQPDEPALGFGLIFRPSAIASLILDGAAAPEATPRDALAPRLRGWASPRPRPSSSTPSFAWSACSTTQTTATSLRR